MKILSTTPQEVPIDQLVTHPRNARSGDVSAIQCSIEHHGFYGAVVAQRSTGYILAGNHRYLAARAARMTTIPTLWVDVSDDEALRIMLADNRAGDLAAYDDTELVKLLEQVRSNDIGLAGTLWKDAELADLAKQVEAGSSGFTAEEQPDGRVRVILGKHEFHVQRPDYDHWMRGVLEEANQDMKLVNTVILKRLGIHSAGKESAPAA